MLFLGGHCHTGFLKKMMAKMLANRKLHHLLSAYSFTVYANILEIRNISKVIRIIRCCLVC